MAAVMTVSLLLNIAVLVPVCVSILLDAAWTRSAYGVPSPARGILLSVYFAIVVLSALLLARPAIQAVAALLLIQIFYKLTTPFTVGTLRNPVVASNLAIAAVHAGTVGFIWKAVG